MARKRLLYSEPQCAQELARAARQEKCARVRGRMLAVRHLLSGHHADETAGLFLIGRSQLYYWLQRYRSQGLSGLRDRPRSGAPKHLKPEDERAFRLLMETRATACRAEEIRKILRERFNANYSLSGVYMLLQRLGLSNFHRESDS